jgi:hypothetical protein
MCSEFDASVVDNKILIHCNAFFVIVCSVLVTFMNMISDVKYAVNCL